MGTKQIFIADVLHPIRSWNNWSNVERRSTQETARNIWNCWQFFKDGRSRTAMVDWFLLWKEMHDDIELIFREWPALN